MKTTEITKNNPLFKPLKWLSKAISKDKTREILNYAAYHSKEQVLVGTDGRRLHKIKGNFLASIFGNEDTLVKFVSVSASSIVIMPVETDLTYPDWERTIPQKEGEKVKLLIKKGDNPSFRAFKSIQTVCPCLFDEDFFKDFIGIGSFLSAKGDSLEIEFEVLDDTSPLRVHLVNGEIEMLGILMPMRG